jgi:hypothetical protein
MMLQFSRKIFEKYSYAKFHEIRRVGAQLLHVDGRTYGQTDMTKLIVAIRNYAHAPKISEPHCSEPVSIIILCGR